MFRIIRCIANVSAVAAASLLGLVRPSQSGQLATLESRATIWREDKTDVTLASVHDTAILFAAFNQIPPGNSLLKRRRWAVGKIEPPVIPDADSLHSLAHEESLQAELSAQTPPIVWLIPVEPLRKSVTVILEKSKVTLFLLSIGGDEACWV